jgi:3'-5' exoribonuclease
VKDFFVCDASEQLDQIITTCLAVRSKQVRTKKNGEPYLALTLSDRTGSIEAKLWHHVDIASPLFDANDFLLVKGRVTKYNDRYELVLEKLRRASGAEIEPADFLPKTERDVDDLWRRLLAYVDEVEDMAIRRLLVEIVNDPDVAPRLRLAPAAKVMHHAYLGGLLEHTVSLCSLGQFVCSAYGWLNRDLLIAAAICHDIGKIYELTYCTSLEYSDDGRLLGHISLGLELVRAKLANLPEISNEIAVQLEHIILSHHGSKELGSPVEPSTPEAIVFSHLDNLDAEAHAVSIALQSNGGASRWTEYIPTLRRAIRRTSQK